MQEKDRDKKPEKKEKPEPKTIEYGKQLNSKSWGR